MSSQPRRPDGRFTCDPAYPRKVRSRCGCAGGGSRPCPVARRLRPLRQDAKSRRRRELRGHRLAGDVLELESELYSVQESARHLVGALAFTREQIRNTGRVRHRAGAGRVLGFALHGSEDAYAELLEQRAAERAHLAHLRSEARSLRSALARARARRRRAA